MSVAGQLIITVKGLSGLPSTINSAVILVRVLSRKERKVPRTPEATATASSVAGGVATFEGAAQKVVVFSPFPHEDVLRVHIASAPHETAFAAASLIRVSVIEKSRHIEKDFTLTSPKTKESCGLLQLAIDYIPPSVELPEEELAAKLRAAAAPGKTMSFSQAASLFDSQSSSAPHLAEPSFAAPEAPEDEGKKGSKSHSHRSKKDKNDNSASDLAEGGSSASSSASNKSGSNGMPSMSAEELAAALNMEPDSLLAPAAAPAPTVPTAAPAEAPPAAEQQVQPKSFVSVIKAVSEARDIMLDQAPRRNRESLRSAVDTRPRNNSASQKNAEKALKGGKTTVFRDLPISCTPHEKLTFGLESRQASLETELLQHVSLENKTSKGVCFRFLLRNADHPKFTLHAEPEMGKMKGGQKIDVVLKLVIHCTTNLRIGLQLAMWKGHLKEYDTAVTETLTITAGVQSKLSTKLDSEEVEIFRPSIGSGAFGTVYRGKYRGFEVAVKVLKDQANPSPELLEAFETEVEVAEALRHTSIVNFVGAVHFPGQLALVTEFCPFGDLNSALKKYPFPYPLKLKALLDASRAMDYLHQSGMIHRDLKTENLLVVSLEALSQTVCKLSDFGTARGLNSFAQSKAMNLTKGVGTPIFMAPEILSGSHSYSDSADVYSFGVMMCHVANNELPYMHDRRFDSSYQFVQKVIGGMRPELKADVPSDYKKLMNSCWDKNPEARPPFSVISDMLEDMFFEARKSLPSASILRH